MAEYAPGVRYYVEIQVQSKSKLAGVVVANGRTLPSLKLAVSDGELGAGSIRRFAASLAGLAARN